MWIPSDLITAITFVVGIYLTLSALFATPISPQPKENRRRRRRRRRGEQDSASSEESRSVPDSVANGGEVPIEMTLDELKTYDGSDPQKPLLMSIRGQIYDVSKSRMHYGPGAPNSLFAGREASRALALMSFDEEDLTDDTQGLSKSELEVLQDWECKFKEKYTRIGQVVKMKDTIAKDQLF